MKAPPPEERSSGHPLDRTLKAIDEVLQIGHQPVVVFDLDFTLFDNTPRSRAILKDLVRDHSGDMPTMVQSVARLPADLPYDHGEILMMMGIDPDHRWYPELSTGFGNRFFSNDYLDRDVPIPGAVSFVREAHERGTSVIYLTGRDRQGMYEGTRSSLQAHGFPVEMARASLFMKPDAVTRDWNFKARVREEIRDLGQLVAFFDNEPANVNAFLEVFPGILAVLLATKCAPDPPPVADGVLLIPDFLRIGP